MRKATAVLFAVLFAAACGDDEPERERLSCDLRAQEGQCATYDLTSGYIDNVRVNCPEMGGLLSGTCDAAEALGSCRLSVGSGSITVWFYPPLWTADVAASSCLESGGTWTAP